MNLSHLQAAGNPSSAPRRQSRSCWPDFTGFVIGRPRVYIRSPARTNQPPEPCSEYALGSNPTGTGALQLPALSFLASPVLPNGSLRARLAAREQVGRLSAD